MVDLTGVDMLQEHPKEAPLPIYEERAPLK